MIPSSYNIYGDKTGRSYDDIEQDWGRVFRLVFMSGLATLSSIGNIFTISAIIGDDLLRKKGNSFLASITLADLLISTLVLPASSVAILGQMEDSENICRLQYGVGSMSCLTAAIFTAAIGIENFLRLKSLCHMEKNRERQLKEMESQQQRQPLTSTSSPYHHHPQQSTSSSLNHNHQHHGLGQGLHHHNQHQHAHNNYNSTGTSMHTTSFISTAPLSHTNSPAHQSTHSHSSPAHQSTHAQAPPAPQRPPPPTKSSICTVFQLTLLNLKMWFVSGVIVLIHFIFLPQLLYAICGKNVPTTVRVGDFQIPKAPKPINQQLLLESITVLGVCLLSLVALGGLGFLKCACIIRSWTKPKPYLTSREFALVGSNCWNCLMRFLIWGPSILTVILMQLNRTVESQRLNFDYSSSSSASVIGLPLTPLALTSHPDTSSKTSTSFFASNANSEYAFLQRLLIWPMILPSCLSSLVNIVTNRDFRRCYVQLFHYCCCKTSVALSRRPRESTRASSDVRVHIIPGYNMYSAGSSSHHNEVQAPQPRFATFKFGPHSSRGAGGGGGKRDVYEL